MKRHFTLIEMLVVIAIIITLMAMLMGGWTVVRKKAQTTEARSQLTFLVTAISQYRSSYNSLFPYHGTYSANKAASDLRDVLIYDGGTTTPDQLLVALYGQDASQNPRKIQFIETGIAETDPWGNSYRIALDLDYDGNIADDKIYGSGELVKEVVVWSRGPDGSDSSTDNDAVNQDNINSWK